MRAVACVACLACAAQGAAAAPAPAKPVAIKPGGSFEKCVSLMPPQKLQYHFGANHAVNFSVHYHKGELVYSPVKLDKAMSGDGEFTPPAREDYCMTWENRSPSAEVLLDFGFKIVH